MKNEQLQSVLHDLLDFDKTIVIKDVNLESKGISEPVRIKLDIDYFNPLLLDEKDLTNYTYPLLITVFELDDQYCTTPIASFNNPGIHRMLTHELRALKLYELITEFLKEDNDVSTITEKADLVLLDMLNLEN